MNESHHNTFIHLRRVFSSRLNSKNPWDESLAHSRSLLRWYFPDQRTVWFWKVVSTDSWRFLSVCVCYLTVFNAIVGGTSDTTKYRCFPEPCGITAKSPHVHMCFYQNDARTGFFSLAKPILSKCGLTFAFPVRSRSPPGRSSDVVNGIWNVENHKNTKNVSIRPYSCQFWGIMLSQRVMLWTPVSVI